MDKQKHYYGIADIMARYDVGENKAQQIIKEAQSLHQYPGGKLGKGKLLPSELALWENTLPLKQTGGTT